MTARPPAVARPIPGLDEQPPATVRDAYWIAAELAAAGWELRRLTYIEQTGTGVVIAQTPSRRVVTVTHTVGGTTDRRQVPATAAVVVLAIAVAHLGAHDEANGDEQLDELRLLLQAHMKPARRAARRSLRWRCTEHLPTMTAGEQPRTPVRAAAWIMATLIIEYGWGISHLGEEVAGGGFVARIPGDVAALFPSAMADDGTAATALARMMPMLSAKDIAQLRRFDYRAIYAAGRNGQVLP